MRWVSRLTTIAVILIVVAGAALLIRSKVPETQYGGSFKSYTTFRDASRLQPGSPVVVAGVRIGDITGLAIEGRVARIDLRLDDKIKLPIDSFATRKADSLFGDSYIEIIPGESKEYLKNGDPIAHVEEGGSTDNTLRAIARTMPKIDNALENVHRVAIDGRKWVNSKFSDRIEGVDQWLAEDHINGPVESADRAFERFEDGANRAYEAVHDARTSFPDRLDSFNAGITNARKQMKDARAGLVQALADARAGFDRIDEPVDNFGEIVAAINEGRGNDYKGTLGRLVNEPDLGNDIEDVTADAAEGARGLNRFKSWIGARMEFSIKNGTGRFYATAEVDARNDKFYLVEFEKSGLGGYPYDSLTEVVGSDAYVRRQQIEDRVRFTIQFGKRFGFMQLRAGIKDSTAGIGADALFMNGQLRISSDLFGSFDRTPRLKVAAAFAVFRSIYVLAGVDDALNEPGELSIRTGNTPVPEQFKELHYGRDYFVGAMLQFDDQDLATMLRFYGALIGGFLLVR
ncbi:MAG TPA: MlaD family protein [Kofleriaceae bacterium]|nr:MlaD family protein [Kofleriaceae bacterium]